MDPYRTKLKASSSHPAPTDTGSGVLGHRVGSKVAERGLQLMPLMKPQNMATARVPGRGTPGRFSLGGETVAPWEHKARHCDCGTGPPQSPKSQVDSEEGS